jgi:hypothetical protein
MITTHKINLVKRCLERGYLLSDVMPCVIKQDGDIWTIDETHEKYPHQRDDKIYLGTGVGTELKKILSLIGITTTPDCSCNAKAKIMNEKGIEWCKNNIDVIANWLKEEAVKRNMPFYSFIAKKLIKIAIGRAER